jgi:hypothetical protein
MKKARNTANSGAADGLFEGAIAMEYSESYTLARV